jgi:putative ABC transport system permease protein
MATMWQDVRYGIRMLLKSPGMTAIAVLAIALGVGANTAIFSVVNAVLLRPLPFTQPDRLVRVFGTNVKKGVNSNPTSYLNFVDWRDQSHAFEQMVAYGEGTATLTGIGTPEQIEGATISASVFPMLGVNPILGRTFTSDEEQPGKTHVVVISEGLWRRRFGADPGIIGRTIMVGGDSTTVVGIMPQSFKFPVTSNNLEFWTPIDPASPYNTERGSNYLSVAARLKTDATLAQAQSEMDTIAQRLEQEYPTNNTGRGIRLESMHEATVGNVRPALLVLLGAVGCVLLIACANVANLLLARANRRHREIAVRTALGATRGRIARQLLTESVLLAAVGGTFGLLIAAWGMDFLIAGVPANLPRVEEISLDWRVLLFTFSVSILTGLIFGLAPAVVTSKIDLNESLKEGGRTGSEGARRNRVRNILVVTEIAISLMLLIGAGLLLKSFERLRQVNPGFSPERVVTMSFALPGTKYKTHEQQSQFFQQLLARVGELSGVEAAGIVDPLPLSNNMWQNIFTVEGHPTLAPGDRLIASARITSAEYMRAMQIPLVRGRMLTERDNKDAQKVMLINETLARHFFPGEDPLGKRATVSLAPEFTCEIVGIVGDVKHRSLDAEAGPEFYVTYLQAPTPSASLVVRTKTDEMNAVIPAIRNVLAQLDPDQPIADVRTMNGLLAESTASRRFNMLLLGIFALMALVLTGVGIYGVMSYSVMQRSHEIGIRMALGAQSRDVFRLVVGQGMMLALIGVVMGIIGALAMTRIMASLLYGVSAVDPVVFASVPLLVGAIALMACYIPARKAMRLDPLRALHYE